MKLRSHTFRGKRWRVRFQAIKDKIGDIDSPNEPDKLLRLCPKTRGLEQMTAAIHEGLHACFWDIDEESIEPSAEDIAKFLWRLGYRKE